MRTQGIHYGKPFGQQHAATIENIISLVLSLPVDSDSLGSEAISETIWGPSRQAAYPKCHPQQHRKQKAVSCACQIREGNW
jgi:hypothetical protein